MGKEFIVRELEGNEEENIHNEGKNIVRVTVQLPSGDMVSGKDCIVEICLSKEARLTLGAALIRSNLKEDFHFTEVYPSTKGNIVEYFGAYLHPKSCITLICENDFSTIEEEVEKAEKDKATP